jgi:hypothetical protein
VDLLVNSVEEEEHMTSLELNFGRFDSKEKHNRDDERGWREVDMQSDDSFETLNRSTPER